VQVQNGKVASWSNSPADALRVKMLPTSGTDENAARARGYFTIGSTKDEVLGAQGTPTSFSDTQWIYGYSRVQFQGGKVTGWSNSPANPLKASQSR
jgi:hypothetical protein